MRIISINILLKALLFTFCCTLLIALLNPFTFLSTGNLLNYLLYFSVVLFSLSLAGFFFASKLIDKLYYNLATIFILLLVPLIAALILFSLLDNIQFGHFTFYGSFLIISIPIVALFSLNILFTELLTTLKKSNKTAKLDNQNVDMFRLFSQKGKLLFEESIDSILCFEANDNYVNIYYLNCDKILAKKMVRFSLKNIQKKAGSFERVHKSYLINPLFILHVEGKSQAYSIKLYNFENLIPVSRSYDVSFLNSISPQKQVKGHK